MLTYDDNQKATNAHCRLAFSAQPQRFSLPLLVEKKVFWKVTFPSTLIFSAKMFARLTLQFLFIYICICNRVRSVFFFQTVGYVIVTYYSEMKWILYMYFVSLAAWLSFRHTKL